MREAIATLRRRADFLRRCPEDKYAVNRRHFGGEIEQLEYSADLVESLSNQREEPSR